MALKKVKGTLERVLDKNLQDLVRGIRNHKENEVGRFRLPQYVMSPDVSYVIITYWILDLNQDKCIDNFS